MNFFVSSKSFWGSAILFFLALGVMYWDGFKDLPYFVYFTVGALMILSGLVLTLSSSQQLTEGFNSRLNQMGWQDLTKKEQNIIGILILLALGLIFYFTRNINGSFIFAVVVMFIAYFAISVYIDSKD